jgi:hypothetical protein
MATDRSRRKNRTPCATLSRISDMVRTSQPA